MSDAHSGMQAHLTVSICGQVSHKAYAAGLFTSAWPRSQYRKGDIRAAALLAVLKVEPGSTMPFLQRHRA